MARVTPLIVSLLLVGVLLIAGCAGDRARTAAGFQDSFGRGAVAADHAIASEAGAEMLALGGNAVDAAVASSFTLSVVRPYSCGIGGGGFMVICLPDDPTHGAVRTALNYRETAPVGPDFFERTGKSSTVGGAAVAVPGTVVGLTAALRQYGTLDLPTVMGPAIRACERGFLVDDHYAGMAGRLIARFESDPELQGRFPLVWDRFLRRGAVRVGDRITNPEQAAALEAIASLGPDAFRRPVLGGAIERAVQDAGGVLTVEDLMSYQPEEVALLIEQVGGLTFLCMPPPSSGGVTMVQTLRVLERAGVDLSDAIDTEPERHLLAEALKHAFADRSRWLADPQFVDVPLRAVLSDQNIARIAGSIDERTHDPDHYGTYAPLPEDAGTSHLSAVDRWGGAVACTETINLEFGSLVGVDEFGFVLNNEMDDFTTVRGQPNAFGLTQSDRNLPEPGKRPLSSMSPTIVLDQTGVLAVCGASGGPRIITGTLQVLLNVLAGMDAGEAVAAPRFHHQWLPDRVFLEPAAGDWAEGFRNRGHTIDTREHVGNVQVIKRSAAGWDAASDPRKGGRPAGH
ncbi:MAG: gamma-glutamyltransferase [Planctomycetota bacterium]